MPVELSCVESGGVITALRSNEAGSPHIVSSVVATYLHVDAVSVDVENMHLYALSI